MKGLPNDLMSKLTANPGVRNPGALAGSIAKKRGGAGSPMPAMGMSQSKSMRPPSVPFGQSQSNSMRTRVGGTPKSFKSRR